MTISPFILEAYERKTWLPTRGGDKRRVICTDAPDCKYPVIVVNDRGVPLRITADGKCWYRKETHSEDLLPPKRQFDVCVYETGGGGHFFSGPETTFLGLKLLARATIEEGEGLP